MVDSSPTSSASASACSAIGVDASKEPRIDEQEGAAPQGARARSVDGVVSAASSARRYAAPLEENRPRARHHSVSATHRRRAFSGALSAAHSIAAARLAASVSRTSRHSSSRGVGGLRLDALREREKIAVAVAERLELARLREPLERVLAHGLEEAVADGGGAVLGVYQRLVDQRREQIEDLLALEPVSGTYLLRRLEREPAGERGHAAKERLLRLR